MTAGKESLQGKTEIDWRKELGFEIQGLKFSYIIPKDPLLIERFITAAVYKTLSGEEIVSREIGKFFYDSLNIKDEVMEHHAREMMEQGRNIVSRNTGYRHEQEEAISQGKKAKEDIDKYGTFVAYYDYWSMVVPIKSYVRLSSIKEFPQHLLLEAKLSEINGIKGFPDNLLSREVSLKKLPKDSNSVFEFAQKAAGKLGVNSSDFLQSMFDKEDMIFVAAMNSCGHTNFDEIRSAIVYSGEKGHKTYSLHEKFKMLSEEEKRTVQKPSEERLNGAIVRDIESDKSKATFLFDVWMNGRVWYSPEKQRIEGELTPSECDAIYLGLRPAITPSTTHLELLGIRKKGQVLAKDLGFPEKQNIDW